MNKQAYKLMHEGTLAFADMESNGIRVDTAYCKKQMKDIDKKIQHLENKLDKTRELKKWHKVYGHEFNLDSNDQLKDILFMHLGIEPPQRTKKGNPSVDAASLHLIDSEITKPLIQWRQLKKMNNTYLKNIIGQSVNGRLHPFFNLNKVVTYRSSSDSPNFQNMPIRDPYMGKIIRQAFIPSDGGWIGGLDYAGIELSIAGCNSRDPVLIDNFTTIHKTMAAMLYDLELDQVTKDVRYCGKNNFVFPELYGSWYKPCAFTLLASIKEMKLKRVDGVGIRKHLKQQGLGDTEDFIQHVKEVEEWFWNTYHVHKKWQKKWLADYAKKGYIEMLTGFQCGGQLSTNKLLNYANQGPAFHCLLWSIVRMNKWLKKYKMKSMVIGQIHDDMVMDINGKEKDDVLHKAKEIMCEEIKKDWKWIITPLEIEAEFSEVNWFEKKEIKI
ncbi:hypothetical protein HN682_06130 [Candidatus Peregrinibacteria bacterium]|jgi:DNA polymerase I|nr:hypothetical protein [Candidatus Peregrinibacteria bacterium]